MTVKMCSGQRIGVVLFQLGGPDSPEAIEPFLYNLFCDPDIIDFPFARLGRKPLAKLISTTRARKVHHHYGVMGGFSPIRRFTEEQARALESHLRRLGMDAHCFVAMRYWHPFTAEAIAQLEATECDKVVLLPLYPQYSSTTTGSSLNEWKRQYRHPRLPKPGEHTPALAKTRLGRGTLGAPSIHVVQDFYRDTTYLDAFVERIDEALARFADTRDVHLVFSAHSVPISVVERGDPYQRQIEETTELLMARGGWDLPHRLCYQSKVGASKWLQPSLRATLHDLAANNAKQVCVVPVSFVSDHLETLGEIDHEARELAGALGISQFEMVRGLNDSPKFIEALASIVLRCIRAVDGVQHTSVSVTPTGEAEMAAAD